MDEIDIENHPKPNEDWITFFRRKRQFADLILMAWSTIEFYVDQLVAAQSGFDYDNNETRKSLEKMSFTKKLEFLNDNQRIKNDEFKILRDFKNYRNKIFHGKEPHYFNLPKLTQDEIMDNAVEAVNAINRALFRKN